MVADDYEANQQGSKPGRKRAALGALGALWARTRTFLTAHRADVALVVVLATLTLFARVARLEPIENGGDPLDNWYFVRQWAYDNDPARARMDHHASRFGIHWITWVAQSIFGTHPRVYYVPQLFASTLTTVLTYVVGRQVSGRVVGFVSALLVLECQPFVSASSQLRPGIFQAMYALAAMVCLLRFIGVKERRAYGFLSASAVFVFLAYLSHEPSAFLVPGMLLVVWLARRSVRDLLVFAGVLGILVGLETAAYATFTHYWGRVDVLSGSHLTQPTHERSFGYLLERFTRAGPALRFAYYPFFVAGPLLCVFRRNLGEKAVVVVAASFLFLVTFFVRSLDPLLLFMEISDRYILITVPFAFIATTHGLFLVGQALLEWLESKGIAKGARRSRAVQAFALAAAAALVMAVGWHAASAARKPHPFFAIAAIYDTLNDTYRRRLPIVAKVTKRTPKITQVRALHWAHKGFLRDEFFIVDGRLRDFKYGVDLAVLSKDERYIPDVPELDRARVRELERRGCALRLTTRGSFVELSQKKRLPSRCHP